MAKLIRPLFIRKLRHIIRENYGVTVTSLLERCQNYTNKTAYPYETAMNSCLFIEDVDQPCAACKKLQKFYKFREEAIVAIAARTKTSL